MMDQSYIEESATNYVPKKRLFFGMEFAPRHLPLSRRVQTLAVSVYIFILIFLGVFSIPVLAYLLFFTQYYTYVLIYLAWYLYDFETSEKGGRSSYMFSQNLLWFSLRDYFPIKLIKTAEIDPAHNYIFGYHPHGVLGFGTMAIASEANRFRHKFPGITPHLAVLRGWFRLPFAREIMALGGGVSCSKESIRYVLREMGPGSSIVLPVGGAAEVLEARPGKVTLKLKNRKGFVERAYINGAKLVPIFAFGENELYDQLDNPEGSLTRNLQYLLKKFIGIYPTILFGRGIFQYTYGILPHRKPITVVVGKPIDLPFWPNPVKAEVDKTHAEYLEAVKELFDKFKGAYGSKDQELEFI